MDRRWKIYKLYLNPDVPCLYCVINTTEMKHIDLETLDCLREQIICEVMIK
jgi:hypothetical protein